MWRRETITPPFPPEVDPVTSAGRPGCHASPLRLASRLPGRPSGIPAAGHLVSGGQRVLFATDSIMLNSQGYRRAFTESVSISKNVLPAVARCTFSDNCVPLLGTVHFFSHETSEKVFAGSGPFSKQINQKQRTTSRRIPTGESLKKQERCRKLWSQRSSTHP